MGGMVGDPQLDGIHTCRVGELVDGHFECEKTRRLTGSTHETRGWGIDPSDGVRHHHSWRMVEKPRRQTRGLTEMRDGGGLRDCVLFSADQPAVTTGHQGNMLFGARPVTRRREHLVARQHEFDRTAHFSGRYRTQSDMHPQEALGAERTADEGGQDPNVGLRNAEIRGECLTFAGDPPSAVVHRQNVVIPMRDRRCELDRIMRVDRRRKTGRDPCA